MAELESKDTKERILDAAERLFAERGFEATSLRSITGRAGVNLAAIHYHFGSKEALIDSVFARRLGPLNDERLRLLAEAEAASGEAGPGLDQVLEAFLGPPLRLPRDPARGGPVFMHLMGRVLTESSEYVQRIFVSQFRAIAERFIAAIRRALPELTEREIYWRMFFAIGAMAHAMSDTYRLRLVSSGACDPTADPEETLRRLVGFVSAGLAAPVTTEGPR